MAGPPDTQTATVSLQTDLRSAGTKVTQQRVLRRSMSTAPEVLVGFGHSVELQGETSP